MVTGGTDGIGKGFCTSLAKRGINIIYLARNKEKYEECSKNLKLLYKIETRFIEADFEKSTAPGFFENIEK